MGFFDFLSRRKEEARARELAEEARRREEDGRNRPKYSTISIETATDFPCYDFHDMPVALTKTPTTHENQTFASGLNFETSARALADVANSLSQGKTHAVIREAVVNALRSFREFDQSLADASSFLTFTCNYDYYVEGEEVPFDEVDADESIVTIEGSNVSGQTTVDVLATLDKFGGVIEMEVDYLFDGDDDFVQANVLIEPKKRGRGFKATFDVY